MCNGFFSVSEHADIPLEGPVSGICSNRRPPHLTIFFRKIESAAEECANHAVSSDANYDKMATVTPAFRGGLVTPPRNTAEEANNLS